MIVTKPHKTSLSEVISIVLNFKNNLPDVLLTFRAKISNVKMNIKSECTFIIIFSITTQHYNLGPIS